MLKFQITKEDAIGGTRTEIKDFKTLKEFWKYTSKNYITNIKTLEEENYSCGACGEICEETDGTISMNSGLLEFTHKAELCSAQDEVYDYEGTIRFTTDKELTNEQLAQLIDLITLQIVEPVNEEQEDEDYSTRNAEVTVREVK